MDLWNFDPSGPRRKPPRVKHDKALRAIVEELMRKGTRILFVDAKGFTRPDIIYQKTNGTIVGLDLKTKKGKVVRIEKEIR